MIDAGQMHKRLTLQRNSPSAQDDCGEDVANWQDVSKHWASMEHQKGVEEEFAGQQRAKSWFRIATRWFPGLTARDRFALGERTFNIVTVNDVGEWHAEYQILAVEVEGP